MKEVSNDDFEEVKIKGEAFYKNLSSVYCPYFKEKVQFNTQGLEHLKFKRREKARTEQDQFMRLKLIHLAPEVLKTSHTLQGILHTKKFERVRIHSRTDLLLRSVDYYEFIAVINRDRVKVIVKQIDGGEKMFWSLIPFWGMNDRTRTRLLHEGVPEED